MPRREDKGAIIQSVEKFVSRDVRSFETVWGDGFSEMGQGLEQAQPVKETFPPL